MKIYYIDGKSEIIEPNNIISDIKNYLEYSSKLDGKKNLRYVIYNLSPYKLTIKLIDRTSPSNIQDNNIWEINVFFNNDFSIKNIDSNCESYKHIESYIILLNSIKNLNELDFINLKEIYDLYNKSIKDKLLKKIQQIRLTKPIKKNNIHPYFRIHEILNYSCTEQSRVGKDTITTETSEIKYELEILSDNLISSEIKEIEKEINNIHRFKSERSYSYSKADHDYIDTKKMYNYPLTNLVNTMYSNSYIKNNFLNKKHLEQFVSKFSWKVTNFDLYSTENDIYKTGLDRKIIIKFILIMFIDKINKFEVTHTCFWDYFNYTISDKNSKMRIDLLNNTLLKTIYYDNENIDKILSENYNIKILNEELNNYIETVSDSFQFEFTNIYNTFFQLSNNNL